jgi:hypothetical protein
MYRFMRLLGKSPYEAVHDPELNAVILAWEVLRQGRAKDFWELCQKYTPREDPGFSQTQQWRELVARPADASQACETLTTIIKNRLGRLRTLLAAHEETEAVEASEAADRASFDFSPAFERLRRAQSARSRELHLVLGVFLKLRKTELEGEAEERDEWVQDEAAPLAVQDVTNGSLTPPAAEAEGNSSLAPPSGSEDAKRTEPSVGAVEPALRRMELTPAPSSKCVEKCSLGTILKSPQRCLESELMAMNVRANEANPTRLDRSSTEGADREKEPGSFLASEAALT